MRRPDRRPRAPHDDPGDPGGGVVDLDGSWSAAEAGDSVAGERVSAGRDLARLPETYWRDYWQDAAALDEIADAARARRVPHVLTGVTFLVGAGAWGCVQMVEVVAGYGPSTIAAAIVWLGTAVAVPVARAVLRERIDRRWVRTWWTATAAAAVWVDVVVAQGADLLTPGVGITLLALLVIGSWLLGARWADEHEVPEPVEDLPEPEPAAAARVVAETTEVEVEVVDDSAAVEIEQDWAARVAAGKTPIARGSELAGRTELPYGFRWVVVLDREESVGATALETDGTAARVAHKLGLRATHVMLERLEGAADREDRAMLTVVTHDVLAGGVDYRGPNYAAGVIRIGRYADGAGDAHWTAYDHTGVQCGLVTGEQRSGKSAFMAKLGGDYKSSGEWTILVGDGDPAGGSSPQLAELADDNARGPAEVLQQLEGLEAIQRDVRGDLMGTLTVGPDGKPTPMTHPGQVAADKMLPCPQYPGIVWVLDEFHRLANDPELKRVDFVLRVGKVVRGLAKYGVALIVGTQSALGGDFGGDSDLRAMLAKNQVTMRTRNKSERGVVGDATVNPASLPKGGGYAFLGDGSRVAMIRTEFTQDPVTGASTLERWIPQIQAGGAQLDELTWAVYRRYRPVRVFDRAADHAERTARLAAVRTAIATGAPLPGSPEAAAAGGHAASKPTTANGPKDAQAPPSIGGFAIPTLADVVPLHRGRADNPARPDSADPDSTGPDAAPGPAGAPLPPKARQVLDALESRPGAWRSGELVEETGLSAPDVSKALRVLVDRGLAHRPDGVRGVHTAGPTPQRYGS